MICRIFYSSETISCLRNPTFSYDYIDRIEIFVEMPLLSFGHHRQHLGPNIVRYGSFSHIANYGKGTEIGQERLF